jgi:hypothetical protein
MMTMDDLHNVINIENARVARRRHQRESHEGDPSTEKVLVQLLSAFMRGSPAGASLGADAFWINLVKGARDHLGQWMCSVCSYESLAVLSTATNVPDDGQGQPIVHDGDRFECTATFDDAVREATVYLRYLGPPLRLCSAPR